MGARREEREESRGRWRVAWSYRGWTGPLGFADAATEAQRGSTPSPGHTACRSQAALSQRRWARQLPRRLQCFLSTREQMAAAPTHGSQTFSLVTLLICSQASSCK